MEFEEGPKPLTSLAERAVQEIDAANQQGRPIDPDLIDEVAGVLHEQWLTDNAEAEIPESKRGPYGELAEEEKEQYRIVVKRAVEALKPKRVG